jgi:hypothetical protein
MFLIFFIILGVLLFLLAKETVLLIGAIMEFAALLIKLIVQLLILAFLGIRGLYRVVQSHRVVIDQRPSPMSRAVVLIDRGDGVHVPSRGEW